MAKITKHPITLDLFSGCGGLSYGFSEAGYKILFGIDNWDDALATFEKNHKGAKSILADFEKTSAQIISKENNLRPGTIDVIIGGPPCQGFSISGKRNPHDKRNQLYKSFVSFVSLLRPQAFIMENVPNLISMQGGKIKNQIIKDFEKCGYKVSYRILKASDYGVPQNRRRVFFVGLRNGKTFEFPEAQYGQGKHPYISVKDAIGDLPEETISDGSKYKTLAKSLYQKKSRQSSPGIYNHEIILHSEKTKKIIAMVPDGGNYKNLPKELHATRKVNIAWTRLPSNKPSYTIDTGHNHIFHYKYNRVPTARESARIQSFPDKFIFLGKNKASHLKQIGNAVPPMLAKALATQLKKYL